MGRKPIYYSFLIYIWSISLIVLFCGVNIPHELAFKSFQTTLYDQSIAASYFHLSSKSYEANLLEKIKIKNPNMASNAIYISINRFAAFERPQNKYATVQPIKVFQSDIHTAFLLLDRPPPYKPT